MLRLGFALLGALSIGAAPPPSLPVNPYPPNSFEGRILALHNGERSRFGLVPMRWDPSLAAGAAEWAWSMAQSGIYEHSPKNTRPGTAENLAWGTRGYFGADRLVGGWLAEKAVFMPGIFPNNSRTGNWLHVSHYTQIIWPSTTRVGCAMASGRGNDFLVCRYSPKGNQDGRSVGYPQGERG